MKDDGFGLGPDDEKAVTAATRQGWISIVVALVILLFIAFVLWDDAGVNAAATARCRGSKNYGYCTACCSPYLGNWGWGFSLHGDCTCHEHK